MLQLRQWYWWYTLLQALSQECQMHYAVWTHTRCQSQGWCLCCRQTLMVIQIWYCLPWWLVPWLGWVLLLSRTQRGTPPWQCHMHCHCSYIRWGSRLHSDKVHNLKQTWFFQSKQVQNYSRIRVVHVGLDLHSVLVWILVHYCRI